MENGTVHLKNVGNLSESADCFSFQKGDIHGSLHVWQRIDLFTCIESKNFNMSSSPIISSELIHKIWFRKKRKQEKCSCEGQKGIKALSLIQKNAPEMCNSICK